VTPAQSEHPAHRSHVRNRPTDSVARGNYLRVFCSVTRGGRTGPPAPGRRLCGAPTWIGFGEVRYAASLPGLSGIRGATSGG
jgi:hypothetical protein